jgi:serine/threonine-protein kinase HipA
MPAKLEIRWWDGTVVGHLVNRGSNFFGYDPGWLERGHNLSPLKLPFTAAIFNAGKEEDGLPGLLADCLPDAWGRKVAALHFAAEKLGPLTPLNLLAWRGSRGLGALQVHPALGDNNSPKLAAITAASLARGAAEIQRGTPAALLPQLVQGATAGGAYPKTLVLAYRDGTLAVGAPDGVGMPALLKLDLSARGGLAQCEHAYASMSRAAGIRSVSTALIAESSKSKRRHLLVHRFDVAAENPSCRFHFHSLARMLHHDHRHAGRLLDYLDLFRTAIKLAIPLAELREIARRMVFNVLAANPDDHGRNHAFLYDEEQRSWSLTPAFDVTFHAGVLDRGLRVNSEVWPRLETMESMGREVGITKAEFAELLDAVQTAIGRWGDHAKRAGVPKDILAEARTWHRRIRESVIPSAIMPKRREA